MRIGLLSTVNSPLLPLIMEALYAERITDFAVILDRKIEADKDLRIWQERTEGFFSKNSPDPYAFENDAPPFYLVSNHNGSACVDLIKRLGISVLANAGTPRRLGQAMLSAARFGVINVHPGILPKYRGCSCVEWAIYNDDAVGNTAHFMTEGYDEGPIIATEEYQFPRDASYAQIRSMTYENGFRLMARSIRRVLDAEMTPDRGAIQGEGQSWKPIPPEKMAAVLEKVAGRNYRFMTL